MRSPLRSFAFAFLLLLGSGAMAQFPYTLIVQGTVAGCTPFQLVTVTTTGSTSPAASYTLEIFPPNCTYDTIIQLNSTYAGVLVSTLCNGQVVTASDSTTFNFLNDTAVIVLDLNCTGGLPDCLGIPNGPNLPGTPCSDNDPNTINDLWSPNCACIGVALPPSSVYVTGTVSPCNGGTYPVHIFTDWGTTPYVDTMLTTGPNCSYEFLFNPTNTSGWVNVEISCDSGLTWMWDSLGFTSTPADTLVIDFTCGTGLPDCLGIPGGSNMPGTACNDGDPFTTGDTWDANCNCVPTGFTCNAALDVLVQGPWSVAFNNVSTGAAPLTYLWTMPDGSNPAVPTPSYVFSAAGIYTACITIGDGNGCTSVDCDTLYVDSTGYISITPIVYDCQGMPFGPDMPGTACDDGDTLTFYDTWDGACNCAGLPMSGQVFISGAIIPCPNPGTPVHIWSLSTLPPVDTNFFSGPNCQYELLVDVISTTGWFYVETSCDTGLTWVVDSLGYSLTAGVDTLIINLSCNGSPMDCLGIPGGPNMPGTACNDGDTLTVQDTWTPTCQCVGVPVNYYDCLGIVNGPNLPGTACDDNNPATIGDTWNANCTCAGSVPQPCNADFWVLQAYTLDSLTSQPVPTPNLLWVWNLSSGGSGAFNFLWSFGDGSSSTDPFPTHTYANGGPYVLCLTVNDSLGCSDTYCDSVSIDANGFYTGMLASGTDRAAGFTINVRDPLATGITEPLITEDGLALWPNPVNDQLQIALTGTMSGTVDVQVIDLNGRLVHSERKSLSTGRNQLQLNTADLDAGLYLLRLGNGNTTISRRFVKAN